MLAPECSLPPLGEQFLKNLFPLAERGQEDTMKTLSQLFDQSPLSAALISQFKDKPNKLLDRSLNCD